MRGGLKINCNKIEALLITIIKEEGPSGNKYRKFYILKNHKSEDAKSEKKSNGE